MLIAESSIVFSTEILARAIRSKQESTHSCALNWAHISSVFRIAVSQVKNSNGVPREYSWASLTKHRISSPLKFHFLDISARTNRRGTLQSKISDSWDKYWANRSFCMREARRSSSLIPITNKLLSTRNVSMNSEITNISLLWEKGKTVVRNLVLLSANSKRMRNRDWRITKSISITSHQQK